MAELNQQITELALDLLGADGLLHPAGYATERPMAEYDTVQEWFLRSRANSIEGGTSEVMRNILGERTLGLPGDVRVDKGIPWSAVPR
jgi:alkylation response protein AidB-like acyl-CoA dehydrogenase